MKIENPLISIIIPTYNRAHIISETLDSVLAQTYINWECIIVDDGSTDDTEKIINEYCNRDARFQYHLRQDDRQKGPNSCRNFGYEMSSGKIINWLDSDDLYKDDVLEKVINKFIEKVDVVVVKLEKVNLKTGKRIGESKIISNNIIEDYFVGKISYYVSGPFWRRSFLQNQNILFDETISNLDDWDFNLRMLYQHPKISYIDVSLIKYRVHENSLSKEIDKLNFSEVQSEIKARKNHIKILEKNKLVNLNKFKKFIIQRDILFFRKAMVNKDEKRLIYLKRLIFSKLKMYDFFGVTRTIFAFIIYSIFGKGYKLLK